MTGRRRAALGLILAGLALVWSSLLGPGVTPARAAPAFFADIDALDIVVTPERMLALVCVAVGSEFSLRLVSVSPSGSTKPFATVEASMGPNGHYCHTPSVAISPGLGGFPKGHIYVSSGASVYHISPDGGTVELFAVIDASSTLHSHNVMTFDDGGEFGYDMLVAGSLGRVYRVRSVGGVAAQFALIPQNGCESTESRRAAVDVAPRSFVPFGGQLLVPDFCQSTLYAVSPLGLISTVTEAYEVGEVQVIPERICGFASTGAAYFLSGVLNEQTRSRDPLFKFPAGDFADLPGSVLVNDGSGDGSHPDYHFVALRSQGGAISKKRLEGQLHTKKSGGFVECPPAQRPVSVADVTVPEGDAGLTTANVDITLPSPSDQEVRLRWATADGSAQAGSDYNAASGTVSFAPGETAKMVGVEVVGDPVPEQNETLSVTLEPVLNATLARGQATVTIADDDASPVVTGVDPNRGPVAGGTRVAVTGTRLGGAQVVRFGPVDVASHPCPPSGGTGRAACFTEESPTRLSVYSPAASAPGAVHIRVTTASGASLHTAADVFTYLDERVAPQAADPPAPAEEPPPAVPPGHVAPPPPAPPGGASTPPGTPGVGPGPGPGPAQAPSPTPGQAPSPTPGQAPSPTPGQAQAPSPTPGQAQAPGSVSAPAPGGSPGAQVGLGAAPAATPEAAVRHAMVRRPQTDPTSAAAGVALVVFGCVLLANASRSDQTRRSAPAVIF